MRENLSKFSAAEIFIESFDSGLFKVWAAPLGADIIPCSFLFCGWLLMADKKLIVKPWTSSLPGHIGYWDFWQVCPHKEFQKNDSNII